MVTGNHGYRGDNLVTMVTVIDNDKKFSKRSQNDYNYYGVHRMRQRMILW